MNELDYKPENIEIEKEYSVKAGHGKLTPRIDVLVKDENGNPFFFIEVKAPSKYEKDKSEIEGQLFSLAQAEEKDFKTKVKYLVYYTSEIREEDVMDKVLIIDFEKYRTYTDWENDGFISIGTEAILTVGSIVSSGITVLRFTMIVLSKRFPFLNVFHKKQTTIFIEIKNSGF